MSKKPALEDWHKADIKAALEKAGWSFLSLSKHHGYRCNYMKDCVHKPTPKAERLVAEALNLQPQDIWPSRYHLDGTPKSGRGERGLGRYKAKFNASSVKRNVNSGVVN